MEITRVDPADRFQGTVMVVAPHMDDEVLACGGLLALLPNKDQVRIVYATDGMRSPSPVIAWRDSITPDLGEQRMRESECAVGLLGIPKQNLHFLRLPEAELSKHRDTLERLLLEQIAENDPDHLFIPFRYDRHPDHLAINRVVTAAHRRGLVRAQLTEYFVYWRSRLLPQRDVRKYVHPQYLLQVDLETTAARKRAALACFTSQTTKFYSWQTRPILTAALLDEESEGPEIFLQCDSAVKGSKVLARAGFWIRIAHRLEPRLQKWKYIVKSSLVRGVRGDDDDS
jgi:LmbE family N-acetylglucosaminyl deacetylase